MAYRIMVVDDSAMTRAAVKRIIGMVDVDIDEIIEAENGSIALDMLSSEKVDLVLADLNMPQMGGVELVSAMKESQSLSAIPVVIVSTESSTTRIDELRDKGIDGYLHKPFNPEEFRGVIETVLGA